MIDPSSGPGPNADSGPEDAAQRRRLVDQLFDAALDLPARERAGMLDERCPTTLRGDVDRLLAAVDDAGSETFVREGGALLGAFGSKLADLMDEDAPLEIGDEVGPYRVVQEIGRGGMAAVYLAERFDGTFEQKVALKVALGRHQGPRSRARFELERQILAGLRHPSIAQLLDGGVTEAGHPFFVMEWVHGRSIDTYCDDERLTIDERLRLFVEIGRAVETAHRSLIVHRDLKPKNVLVTTDEVTGRPQVKLLDFGIAKVLTDEEGVGAFGTPGLTRTSMPMTPDYASPEQLLGEPLTTAVDVYQLGLLLFELLCGTHPFEGMSLVERLAKEHTPTRPSLLLNSGEAAGVAERRSTDTKNLRRQLSGDLETVVMTALRSEPERRYATAKAMVDDVQSYLRDLPIEARGDSLAYRARKFVHRNLTATVATALSLLVLVAVVTASMVRLRLERDAAETARQDAERASAESEQMVAFLVDLFEVSEGGKAKAASISALDLLERGVETIHEDLADSPLLRARLLYTLADVHRSMALYSEGLELAQESLAIREDHLDPNSLPVASSLEIVARLMVDVGQRNEALPLIERSFEIRQALLPPDDPQIAMAMESLSSAYWYQGRYTDVEPLVRKALAIREAAFGRDHRENISLHVKMSILLRTADRYDQALHHAERALEISRAVHGPNHPLVASSMNVLALTHTYLGNYDIAEKYYLDAIDILSNSAGADSSLVSDAMLNLGGVYQRQGRFEETVEIQQRALKLREETLGPNHPRVALALNNLGSTLQKLDRPQDAVPLFRRAIAIFDGIGQLDHPESAWPLNGLGGALTRLGQYEEAEELILRALHIRQESYEEDSVETGQSYLTLARLQHATGRLAEADANYLKSVEIRYTGGDKSNIRESVEAYVDFLREQGRPVEAEEVLARYAVE